MADDNLYAPPTADLNRPADDEDFAITGPHVRSAGDGARWLTQAFAFFRDGWLQWLAATVILLVIYVVVQLIPFIGAIAMMFLGPVFSGGLMIGARAQEQGEDFQVGHLFAGFSTNSGGLLTLGALYLALQIVAWAVGLGIMFLFMGSAGMFGAMVSGDPGAAAAVSPLAATLGVLVIMAVLIPTAAAIWLAPPLVALHGMPALQAMKMSLVGCLKNILAFLIYGLLGLVLAVLATLPLMLGWLILVPVIIISVYTAYRDIFSDTPATLGR
ncbi:MAG: BPSS1780 family membrane protein [Gammaproteobacteria bacterium]|nr:BPSS1780 family membrane protein [Gammaproteobacteria bacterium]